jgi:hypothetical protein
LPGERPNHTLQDIAEGALKLHALFGTRIVISDVQLTDSETVVKLFSNPDFREFLKVDHSFLTLVAQPRDGVSNMRLALATRGLDRAFGSDWMTSLPDTSVEVIKRFADPLLSAQRVDTHRWLRERSRGPGRTISDYPEHKQVLEGMLYGVCHFTARSGGPVEETPIREPRSYTHFIEDALNGRGIWTSNPSELEKAWELVKTWVPDESKRFARSSINKALEAREPDRTRWPREWHQVWNTVVHAWNGNVCDTLDANRASIVKLPFAQAPYRGAIYDIAGPLAASEDGELREKISRRFPLPGFNPSSLSWATVQNLVQQVSEQRDEFQKEFANGNTEGIEDSGAKLIRALTSILAPPAGTKMPHWISLPLSVGGLVAGAFVPLASLLSVPGVLNEGQALIRSAKWPLVWNTLNGFKRDLTSGISR